MKTYDTVLLYYFSGTGNSATAGKRIAEIAVSTGASCESCMRCMNFCPRQAIEYPHLYIALVVMCMVYLNNIVFNLAALAPSIPLIHNIPVLTVIKFSLYYVLFFILYWIFFLLIRFKPINDFFTYTSLTKFYKRYRAPDMKLTDFRGVEFNAKPE